MPVIMVLLLALLSADAFENHDAKEDAAALQLEGYFGFPNLPVPISADNPFSRAYGFTFLPIAKIADRDLVGYVEASLMVREFRENGSVLNSQLLQGYGGGMGYEIVKTDKHSGFAFALVGINSDMRDLGSKDVYGDVSYLHRYTLSDGLAFGGGLDLHFYVDTYLPYPLLYLDWKIAEHTKVKINFDTGEIKQFLTERFSASVGAQYDLFHYGLGSNGYYVMDALFGMGRLEYRIGENLFVRLSAKMPISGGETIEASDGTKVEIQAKEGVSIRAQVAYGL